MSVVGFSAFCSYSVLEYSVNKQLTWRQTDRQIDRQTDRQAGVQDKKKHRRKSDK